MSCTETWWPVWWCLSWGVVEVDLGLCEPLGCEQKGSIRWDTVLSLRGRNRLETERGTPRRAFWTASGCSWFQVLVLYFSSLSLKAFSQVLLRISIWCQQLAWESKEVSLLFLDNESKKEQSRWLSAKDWRSKTREKSLLQAGKSVLGGTPQQHCFVEHVSILRDGGGYLRNPWEWKLGETRHDTVRWVTWSLY